MECRLLASCFREFLFKFLMFMEAVHHLSGSNIVYFREKKTWFDAANSCIDKGGSLLLKDSDLYDDLHDEVDVPYKFWIGKSIYSHWITIEGCYKKKYLDVKIESYGMNKFDCQQMCDYVGYISFAVQNDYCACLKEVPSRMSNPERCDKCLDGIGSCGSTNGKFVTVYGKIADDYIYKERRIPDVRVQCLAYNCRTHEYTNEKCDKSIPSYCEEGYHNMEPKTWMDSLYNCYKHDTKLAWDCGKQVSKIWVPVFRGVTEPSPDALLTWRYEVASATSCKIKKEFYEDSISCEEGHNFMQLPYVCQFTDDDDDGDDSMDTGSKTDKVSGSTTKYIIIGVISACIVISIAITVAAVCFYQRLKNRKPKGTQNNSIYETPTQPTNVNTYAELGRHSDHQTHDFNECPVYQETTNNNVDENVYATLNPISAPSSGYLEFNDAAATYYKC